MKKKKLILTFLLFAMTASPVMAQSMSDQQVLEYVKQGMAQGKDQNTIVKELALKGVTQQQAERVKRLYSSQMNKGGQGGLNNGFATGQLSRIRQYNSQMMLQNDTTDVFDRGRSTPRQILNNGSMEFRQQMLQQQMLQQQMMLQNGGNVNMNTMQGQNFKLYNTNDGSTLQNGNILLNGMTGIDQMTDMENPEDKVFGRDIFNNANLTFEPNINIATPPNYQLGPGDEVIIDIWGTSQNTIRQYISPDGEINIEKLGPVSLNGMTVAEANSYIKDVFGKIYNGLGNDESNLNIKLTLGNIRTIQINVMGEVMHPGTYAVSSFSTVFHALYNAGGVSEIGSLRNIKVARGGKNIATVDIYDFIMKGKTQDDISLQDGDVVIVPAFEAMVKFTGNVKRPMKYEMKHGETLSTLIRYAGGFNSDAYTKSLRVIRQNGEEYEVNTVKDVAFSTYRMNNGDMVTADAILDRFSNKLEIKGAVYRPGIYELNGEINTVRALVNEAKGLMGDAFTNRAVLQREHDNLTTEMISVDIKGIMNGSSPDIPLMKGDILYIPSIHDLQDMGDVTIFGEVARPDSYSFSENMKLEDLIIRAGGLLDAASTVRVDVSRRIKNPKSSEYSDSIGQNFTFALKDGFVIDGEVGFALKPYDQVFVRKSPGYQIQQNVTVNGEVLFGGTFSLSHREERLSDIIKKAGGTTPNAYVKGAKLTRTANSDELKRMEDVLKMMNKEFGEAMMDSLGIKIDSTFTVGINLERALANPGGQDDLILREGDVISVPKMNNTVKINGAVMVSNTVAYMPGKSVKYYLEQAGGYADNARKSKKFVIYMNGQVARIGSRDKNKIEPGCEIIVPSKKSKRVSAGEIFSYASSFASLSTMFVTLSNLLK